MCFFVAVSCNSSKWLPAAHGKTFICGFQPSMENHVSVDLCPLQITHQPPSLHRMSKKQGIRLQGKKKWTHFCREAALSPSSGEYCDGSTRSDDGGSCWSSRGSTNNDCRVLASSGCGNSPYTGGRQDDDRQHRGPAGTSTVQSSAKLRGHAIQVWRTL